MPRRKMTNFLPLATLLLALALPTQATAIMQPIPVVGEVACTLEQSVKGIMESRLQGGISIGRRGAAVLIEEGKLGYLLGQAAGRTHNVERTLQNAEQLARIGVHNTSTGRAILHAHLQRAASDVSNVMRSFTNQYGRFIIKESLFSGPGGFLKFKSTWQVVDGGTLRLVTAIPFGG